MMNSDFLFRDIPILHIEPTKWYGSARELFTDKDFHKYLQEFWPIFAARANDLCLQNGKLGQECGKMRERALMYLFYRYLGEDAYRCYLDDTSIKVNERGKDTLLFNRDVSIKTITSNGRDFSQLKVSWIEDKEMANEVASTWKPLYDLLLCRLKWGSDDEGIYYIYQRTQQEVIAGSEEVLKTSGGYGKGTSLSKEVCEKLVNHPDTLKIPITMPEEYRDENFLTRLFDRIYFEVDRGRYVERYRIDGRN